MMASSVTVIKVGGSLFDWPEFPGRMAGFLEARQTADRDERMVLIAGGGPAADIVRAFDRVHGLGDQTAHRLALHAMDLTAVILVELLPGTVAVQSLESLTAVWSAGAIPVLAPRLTLAKGAYRRKQAPRELGRDVRHNRRVDGLAHGGGPTDLAQECAVARRHRSPGSRPPGFGRSDVSHRHPTLGPR